jgi:molybdate transport system ATP-binding protein
VTGLHAQIAVTAGSLELAVEIVVPSGQQLAILGPNGAGKTTLLRTLAGLVRPVSGSVVLDGRTLWSAEVDVPPEDRSVAMLFQEGALFPHLDAVDNVAFAGVVVGRARTAARAEARTWLERVGLPPDRFGRRPAELSGGEARRVALARTLARPAQLVLLDEPLAAVDGPSRPELTELIAGLLADRAVPLIVVTHELDDGRALGGVVAVLESGRITDHGPVEEVLSRQATPYIAGLASKA